MWAPKAPSVQVLHASSDGRVLLAVQAPSGLAYDCRQHVARTADGRIGVVARVRLDNREELLDAFGTGRAEPFRDVDLVLRAYEEWGISFPLHLVGDFSVALYDSLRSRFMCVTDSAAVRAVYFRETASAIRFASHASLLFSSGEGRDANADYFAAQLVTGWPVGDSTPYRGVRRLRPGHMLVGENGDLSVTAYWQPTLDTSGGNTGSRASDRNEYAARFRELLFDAVRTRIAGTSRIWSEVSGGLDSTSIACVAAEMLRSERGDIGPLRLVTQVFDQSPSSDERAWATLVSARHGCEHHFVFVDAENGLFDGAEEGASHWDEPAIPLLCHRLYERYLEIMCQDGPPVLMCGFGAEAVLADGLERPIHLALLLRRGQLRQLSAELRDWESSTGSPYANLLLDSCLLPAIAPKRAALSQRRWAPSWTPRALADRVCSTCDALSRQEAPDIKGAADRWHYSRVTSLDSMIRRGFLERHCDVRYPFFHRPLVEYGFRLPWTLKVQPNRSKPLLRMAMRGVLPEPIRSRATSAMADEGCYRAIRRHWGLVARLAEGRYLADLGVVQPRALLRAAESARQGHSEHLPLLLTALAAELWLERNIG